MQLANRDKGIMRRIHIKDEAGVEIWRYRIFQYGRIVIRSPYGKKYLSDVSEILGWSHDEVERGYWKKYLQVKPSQIKAYILKELIK